MKFHWIFRISSQKHQFPLILRDLRDLGPSKSRFPLIFMVLRGLGPSKSAKMAEIRQNQWFWPSWTFPDHRFCLQDLKSMDFGSLDRSGTGFCLQILKSMGFQGIWPIWDAQGPVISRNHCPRSVDKSLSTNIYGPHDETTDFDGFSDNANTQGLGFSSKIIESRSDCRIISQVKLFSSRPRVEMDSSKSPICGIKLNANLRFAFSAEPLVQLILLFC